MSFVPIVPLAGFAGWAFLDKTQVRQKAAYVAAPEMQRDIGYFKDHIGAVKTADELIADKRLLRVALTAYGLEGDVANPAFVRKILTDGTLKTTALANRLADKRYLEFSKAFGFGDFSTPNTQLSDFASKVTDLFVSRKFETAVGDQSSELRLALTSQRELPALAAKDVSDKTGWYTVLGSPQLKKLFQTAFGLPTAFGNLDIDKQVEVLKDRASRQLGSDAISSFTNPAQVGKLVRLYLLREQTSGSSVQSAAANALTLLQRSV